MKILRGRHYLTGEPCDLRVDGQHIAAITAPAGDADHGDAGVWLGPGLIDIQVNGTHSHDLCSAGCTADDVIAIGNQLYASGVTGYCPTVTTNSREVTAQSVQAIARACEEDAAAREQVLGIHLEGPYISPIDGPRGAHPLEHVRLPDWDEFRRLQEMAGGRIVLISLAPELPGALPFIEQAVASGVLVALAHHSATREQIHAAVNAGARLATHLGNGSHSQIPRHHNYIWEQLAHDGLMASIIPDGHHLPPAVLKCFVRAKGVSRLILVSDVVAAAGLPSGRYELMGHTIEMRDDGSIHLAGTEYLGGSSLRLAAGVANVMALAGATFAEAITMASTNPAHFLSVDGERGALVVGKRADVSAFRIVAGEPRLAFTMVGGQVRYAAD